jgi:hypothetical protein
MNIRLIRQDRCTGHRASSPDVATLDDCHLHAQLSQPVCDKRASYPTPDYYNLGMDIPCQLSVSRNPRSVEEPHGLSCSEV